MTDETYWHPHDKIWLAERKHEWRLVKYNLSLSAQRNGLLKREYFKFHEELFFFGTLNPAIRDPTIIGNYRLTGHEAFMYALPLFWLWYHPAPESLDLEAMRTEFIRGDQTGNKLTSTGNKLTSLAKILLGMCSGGLPKPVDYGAMGGASSWG